jgi:hypothetical protein
MATRACIAIPTDNGFKGRYSHSDGNPAWLLRQLVTLVNRDGVDAARKMLFENHFGWSYIADGTVADETNRLGADRATLVPGYGLAYSAEEEPDKPITNTEDSGWLAWAYVLNDLGVAVFRPADPDAGVQWEHVGNVRYTDDLTDDVIRQLECGEDFERCSHYAWYHDARVPRENRIGMRQWLGLDPIRSVGDVRSACGAAYTLTGSTTTGTSDDHNWQSIQFNPNRPRYTWVEVKTTGTDRAFWVRLGRNTKAGLRLDEDVVFAADHTGVAGKAARGELIAHH